MYAHYTESDNHKKGKFDLVIRKMLIQEFSKTRLIKRPLEYGRHDSEEEDCMKNCKSLGAVRIPTAEEKELRKKLRLRVRDVQKADREKEKKLGEFFQKWLEIKPQNF